MSCDVVEIDDRERFEAAGLLDPGEVPEEKAVELPEGLDADVGAAGPLVEAAVLAEAEDAALDHLERGLEAVEYHVRDERSGLLAADVDLGGVDHRLARAELGTVGQRHRHQVVEATRRVDQRDLEVVALQRLDHRTRVESEDARQPGALDAPRLPGRDGLLFEVGQHVAGPVDLEGLGQVAAQAGDPCDDRSGATDGVERSGVDASGLMDGEVGVGGLHDRVVLGGLDVVMPGIEVLAGDQREEDRVGGVDGPERGPVEAGPAVEEVGAGIGQDAPVEVGAATIVANIVEAYV